MAAFPLVSIIGLAAKAAAGVVETLPAELITPRAPQATEVYAADRRTLLARFADQNRRNVPLREIAPVMRDAIIAAEDQNFYRHTGVDLKGVLRALIANSTGRYHQGASTLTMQYVRMALTYAAASPEAVIAANVDTGVRKVREAQLALRLERHLTKDEILERYLNMAPFGNGTYGVYAASQFYFGKHPRDLSLPEAAMIAGIVKSPTDFNPLTDEGARATLERRNWVIRQMRKTGAISAEEEAAAQAAPLTVTGERPPNGCLATGVPDAGFFCDYLSRWWLAQPAFGATPYDRERQLKGGGYRVITTLDPAIQAAARRHITRRIADTDPNALMIAAVEPGTGRVRALAANRIFGLDDPRAPRNGPASDPAKARAGLRGTYPYTMNPIVTGGSDITGYQAGSIFKIFTVVAALERGYPLDYPINAPQVYRSTYLSSDKDSTCPNSTRYCPRNFTAAVAGVHNAWTAFGHSVNTYFVPLQERVGAAHVVDVARRMGIQFRDPREAAIANDRAAADRWGAFTLGVSATTPLDVATAYATLAAEGVFCEPTPVEEIWDSAGRRLTVADPRCRRVIDRDVARAAIDVARCPVGDQSAFRECKGATAGAARRVVGHPIAGKTGTTDRYRAASMVVTTRSLTVAGFLADPDWPETTATMTHAVVDPAVYHTLADAMRGKAPVDFPKPPRRLAYGDQVAIPNVTCQSVAQAVRRLRNAGFQVEVEARPMRSPCPPHTVAATQPTKRTVAGGVVVLYLSDAGR